MIVHEVGHWIDYRVLDPCGSSPASDGSMVLDDWQDAIKNSEHIKALRSHQRTAASKEQLRHLAYMLRPVEIWARAYTQWILTGSDRAHQIPWVGASMQRRGITIPGHWLAGDWKAVGEATDGVFVSLGLRRMNGLLREAA